MIQKTLRQKLEDKFLGYIPNGRIHIESALRSNEKGSRKSGAIKTQAKLFEAKTLDDLKTAVAIATDGENPDLSLLSELYQNFWLDAHTVSVIENRVFKVLRSKFVLLKENGKEDSDLKKIFECPWFEEFLKQVLLSKFTGVKVIELFDLDDNLELTGVTLIPMEHTNPLKGLILKNVGDDEGWNYKEGGLAKFYMQIGKDNEIGMLADLGPLILAKKLAFGSWLDYIEKYGIAPLFITTDNMTTERQQELFDMGMEMISNHVGVLQGSEKFEIGQVPSTDTYNVFLEFLKHIDNVITKRTLGQTMTTENGSSRSQAEVHERVANDRHESDKLFAQYIINKHLIPKLIELSSFYSGLNGITFDWDESEQMSAETLIDKAVSLTQAGFVLDFKVIKEKTGMPIIGFVEKSEEPKGKSEEGKEKKEKKLLKKKVK